VLASPLLGRACAKLIDAARNHFDQADEVMSSASRRAVRAPRIMGEVYRLVLEHIVIRGFAPPRHPVRLGRPRLALIIMRYALI
jgi:presqualene diphosphate synthase